MKKVGIYDPYLNILGGAERYILSITRCLKDASVTIFTDDASLLVKARDKFGIPVSHLTTLPWLTDRGMRNALLSGYDLFFYVTDGSLFYSRAKKNILIIQSPGHIPVSSLANRIRLLSWQKTICYSEFVASFIKTRLHKKAEILFVPIEIPDTHTLKKKNLILSVGRFFTQMHNKKQLEMVQVFGEMVGEGLRNTELILAGSIDPGGEDYFEKVRQAATGLPVKVMKAATHTELVTLYKEAKIYWHGAGFGENVVLYPERAEHFGVSTVEAMSYREVPVVYGAGGQTEIVTSGANGFTWRTAEELKKYTRELLGNTSLFGKISQQAYESSKMYEQAAFCEQLHEILESK